MLRKMMKSKVVDLFNSMFLKKSEAIKKESN